MFIVPQYIQGVSFRIQRRHSSWVFFVCIWVSVQRDAHSNTSLSQVGFYRYNRKRRLTRTCIYPSQFSIQCVIKQNSDPYDLSMWIPHCTTRGK